MRLVQCVRFTILRQSSKELQYWNNRNNINAVTPCGNDGFHFYKTFIYEIASVRKESKMKNIFIRQSKKHTKKNWKTLSQFCLWLH